MLHKPNSDTWDYNVRGMFNEGMPYLFLLCCFQCITNFSALRDVFSEKWKHKQRIFNHNDTAIYERNSVFLLTRFSHMISDAMKKKVIYCREN